MASDGRHSTRACRQPPPPPCRGSLAACLWIVDRYPAIEQYFLESNFATDKKSSQVNMLRTRGKRVDRRGHRPERARSSAIMRSNTELMYRARQVSNLGGFMSGVNNNGAHSANGITAMFIATGQDAANVAESSAAFVYAELRPNGDYYYSVTIPSLIVATYGGGTGLATQRECLELLDCYGEGKVRKFAEIVAATVAVRRALARLGDRGRGVGPRPRPARAQSPVGRLRCPWSITSIWWSPRSTAACRSTGIC